MNRIALLSLLVATAGFGQEIGKEIPQPAPYDNPYGPNPANPNAGPNTAPPPPPTIQASAASAGQGSFGLTADFFGSVGSGVLPTGAFGFAVFATDHLKFTLDAGLAYTFLDSQPPLGFVAALGIQPTFRSTAASARPFIIAQIGFGKTFSASSDDFALLLNVGGGGEYFFSPFFAMNIRALVSMPVNLKTSVLGLVLFSPGVGATVYF